MQAVKKDTRFRTDIRAISFPMQTQKRKKAKCKQLKKTRVFLAQLRVIGKSRLTLTQ